MGLWDQFKEDLGSVVAGIGEGATERFGELASSAINSVGAPKAPKPVVIAPPPAASRPTSFYGPQLAQYALPVAAVAALGLLFYSRRRGSK